MPASPRQTLNVYLFDSGVTSFAECLADPDKVDEHIPVRQSKYETRLYTRVTNSLKTRWMRLIERGLEPGTPDPFERFHNKAPGAALLVKYRSRFLAVTFGQGRYLIDLRRRVPRFGLQVALNVASKDGLDTIVAATHQELLQTRSISNSRNTELARFGYDSDQDFLLKAVSKLQGRRKFGHFIAGKDVVNFDTDIDWDDLPIRCALLYRIYLKDWYRRKFPDVCSLEPVTDPTAVADLNRELCLRLASPNRGGFHLSCPDMVWSSDLVGGFSASFNLGMPEPVATLSLEAFLNDTDFQGPQHSNYLTDHVIRYSNDDDTHSHGPWKVFDCLVGELELNNKSYSLSGGQWRTPDSNYLRRLNDAVSGLPADPALLNLNAQGAATEDSLIDLTVAASGGALVKLHPKTIQWGGGHGKIEFADCIGDKKLIYAKMGGSATSWSHLLTQAENGLKVLRNREFRDAARLVYANAAHHIPVNAPLVYEWSVVLLVGCSSVRQPEQFPIVQRIPLKRLKDAAENCGARLYLHQAVV